MGLRMLSPSPKPVQMVPTPTAPAAPPAAGWLEFVGHLARKHAVTGDLLHTFAEQPGKDKKLRELWELTDLSSNDFADETARFYQLSRIDLPKLLAATSFATR